MKKRVALAQFVVRFVFGMCGGLTAVGIENVPRTGRLLLCPNHISDSDPGAVLSMLPRADFASMAKEELFRIPFLGWLMRQYGTFPVVRDSADRKAIRQAEEILKDERALLIFPEGQLSQDGFLQKLQPGAAMIALRTGAPIVPVGVIGTNRVMPYAKLMPRPAGKPAQVRFGKPISMDEFAGLPHKEALRLLTARIGEEIAKLTGQPPPADS